MIGSLRGKVEHLNSARLCSLTYMGLGIRFTRPYNSVETLQVGTEASMVIYTDVNQNHIRLYGFLAIRSKSKLFLLLLRVKGVGPKS